MGRRKRQLPGQPAFFHVLPMERASALPAVQREVSKVGTGPLLHEGEAESLCLHKPVLSLHFQ